MTTDNGIAHIDMGHRGEVNTIDPMTGNPIEPVWYCYTCDRPVAL